VEVASWNFAAWRAAR